MKIPRLQGVGCAAILGSALGLALVSGPASALDLDLPPGAELVHSTGAGDGLHPVATGPWTNAGLPTQDTAGVVQEFIWQISDASSLSLQTALHAQLEAQGYSVDFSCFARACGGFDFRHSLPTGRAPEMFVDLGNFYYISAHASAESGDTHVALMISQGGTTGFVHLALIQPPNQSDAPVIQSTRNAAIDFSGPVGRGGGLVAQLTTQGSAPLDDLQFQTGASQLTGERYASLQDLAAFLADDPARRVVLVGHTDALGSLSGNIALSQARANAVRQYLLAELNVDANQVTAEGIGYLSPRAPNTSPEGREVNRRVEVVLATAR